ncbi:helix-turn-helix domain-containing protein [Reyranella sp.]|uniref:helix-turn-helix domain-containing protein n=1 Tax=Reyranella sp. TaxID=1929291 RepID=UPI003D0C0226
MNTKQTHVEQPRALRVNEFCRLYGIGRSSAYKLIGQGQLASVVIGGRRLILRDSAEELLLMGTNNPAA